MSYRYEEWKKDIRDEEWRLTHKSVGERMGVFKNSISAMLASLVISEDYTSITKESHHQSVMLEKDPLTGSLGAPEIVVHVENDDDYNELIFIVRRLH